jgi:oligopeptidase A
MKKIFFIIITIIVILIGLLYKTKFFGAVKMQDNPLLQEQELPNFNTITSKHFAPAIKTIINNFNQTLTNQILTQQKPTWDNTILPLEKSFEKISHIWSIIKHINSTSNTKETRKDFEQTLPIITEFYSDISQNQQLYNIYLNIKESKEFQNYNNAQKTLVNHAIRDFKLSGVNLPDEKRNRLKEINEKLSKLGNQFSKNILDSTQAWEHHILETEQNKLEGLPEHTINIAKDKAQQKEKAGWILTLDFPCYYSVITFAKDRELRKLFYTAYNTRASELFPISNEWDNTEVINKIIQLRKELTSLLDYKNYAEYSLVPKMAENTAEVMEFLSNLVKYSKPCAEKEFAELKKFASTQGKTTQLEPWDISYFSELYQQTYYQISQETLRPFFPEHQVLSGMFKIAERLFNIQIKEVTNFPKWHDTVKLFTITDQNGELRGKFYTDLYARDFKYSGAWMADLSSRMQITKDKLQCPIAFLVANFTPSVNNKPPLLSHDEVVTLFHEFGHTLHHTLTKIDYPSVAGTNGVAWDAVELPSQFMENWCWEWEVVKELAKHYKTNESLPKDKFEKLLSIKNFQSAMQMVRQLEFSIFDFKLHLDKAEDQNKTVQQILNEVREQVAVVPIPDFNRFQNNFSHIFNGGYSAGYFSYKWAEVLSSDAFENFKENGTFNKDTGKRFLQAILEKGGSKEAMDLFIEFRGRKPTIDALLKHNGIEKCD